MFNICLLYVHIRCEESSEGQVRAKCHFKFMIHSWVTGWWMSSAKQALCIFLKKEVLCDYQPTPQCCYGTKAELRAKTEINPIPLACEWSNSSLVIPLFN